MEKAQTLTLQQKFHISRGKWGRKLQNTSIDPVTNHCTDLPRRKYSLKKCLKVINGTFFLRMKWFLSIYCEWKPSTIIRECCISSGKHPTSLRADGKLLWCGIFVIEVISCKLLGLLSGTLFESYRGVAIGQWVHSIRSKLWHIQNILIEYNISTKPHTLL